MRRTMMHGKIHRATITDANIDYVGSITIDPVLYESAGILPYEKVHVVDVNNGARFETYVIEGKRDSGDMCVNGAAARLVQPGDKVIVIAYAEMENEEAMSLVPKVVLVDEDNHPLTLANISASSS